MPKFKWKFSSDLRDTVEQMLKNEKRLYDGSLGRVTGGLIGRVARMIKLPMGHAFFSYEMLSNTEAIVEISTGLDWALKDEALLGKMQEYEVASGGQIKIELIKEENQ